MSIFNNLIASLKRITIDANENKVECCDLFGGGDGKEYAFDADTGRWITVHPNGAKDGKGRKIHLDESGKIDSKGPLSEAIKAKGEGGSGKFLDADGHEISMKVNEEARHPHAKPSWVDRPMAKDIGRLEETETNRLHPSLGVMNALNVYGGTVAQIGDHHVVIPSSGALWVHKGDNDTIRIERDERMHNLLGRYQDGLSTAVYNDALKAIKKLSDDGMFMQSLKCEYSEGDNGFGRLVFSKKDEVDGDNGVRFALVGRNDDGTEIYETPKDIRKLGKTQKSKMFLQSLSLNAELPIDISAEGDDLILRTSHKDKKHLSGSKVGMPYVGYEAKVNTGASGDIYDILSGAKYIGDGERTEESIAHHPEVRRWMYFKKRVIVDGRSFDVVANVARKDDGDYLYDAYFYSRGKSNGYPDLPDGKEGKGRTLESPETLQGLHKDLIKDKSPETPHIISKGLTDCQGGNVDSQTKAMVSALKDWIPSIDVGEVEEDKVTDELGSDNNIRKMAIRQEEYDKWNAMLDKYENGTMTDSNAIPILDHTPIVLQRIGMHDLPICISKRTIDKITGEILTKSGEFHKVPVSELRNLQIEMDNPIAVFDSRTDNGSKVILTRIVDKENNEKAVVALKANVTQGAIEVNSIASIYGKDKDSIDNWISWGMLRYINKQARKSSAKWLQLPGDSDLRAHSVLTENDFSNEQLGHIIPNNSDEKQGGIRKSLIMGERGAEQLANNASIQALQNLKVAKQMLGDKAWETMPRDEKVKIKLATGWEKGKDGKWRREWVDLPNVDLYDMLSKPTLEYDNLKKDIHDATKEYENALFDSKADTKEGKEAIEWRKSILDSLNAKKEKINPWTSVSLQEIFGENNELFSVYPQLKYANVKMVPNFKGADFELHPNGYMEINLNPLLAFDRTGLQHEIQHAIQHLEGQQFGGMPNNPQYNRLSSEVEARNAGSRTESDRNTIGKELLEDTEDIAREDQVVIGEAENAIRQSIAFSNAGTSKQPIHGKGGKIAGWYDRNTGKVRLVKGVATPSTVAHEIGWHATFHWAEKNHPELHKKLIQYAKEAPEGIEQSVKEKYGTKLTPNELLDEIGAERFTRQDISPLLQEAQKRASEQFFDKVENEQDNLRKAFVGTSKALSREELNEIAAQEPKKAVEMLVQKMLEGRTLGDEPPFGGNDGGGNGGNGGKGEDSGVRLSLVGKKDDGTEIYETPKDILNMSNFQHYSAFGDKLKELKDRPLPVDILDDGKVLNVLTASKDRKKIAGSAKGMTNAGYKAKVSTGVSGDLWAIVSGAKYTGDGKRTEESIKHHPDVKRWMYYTKDVIVDGNPFRIIANVARKDSGDYLHEVLFKQKNPGAVPTRLSLDAGLESAPRSYVDEDAHLSSDTSVLPVRDAEVGETPHIISKGLSNCQGGKKKAGDSACCDLFGGPYDIPEPTEDEGTSEGARKGWLTRKHGNAQIDATPASMSDDEMKRAEEHFGTTTNLDAAGWLLPNGNMLDFNKDLHRKDLGDDWIEHSELDNFLGGDNAGRQKGGIRFSGCPSGLYMELEREPSPSQYEQLQRIADHDWWQDDLTEQEHFVDLGNRHYLTYPDSETMSKRLVSDIKRHFNGGSEPTNSDAEAVRQFHMVGDTACCDLFGGPYDIPESTEDAEWKEDDHPRGQPGNKGQFVKKGAATAAVTENTLKDQSGKPILIDPLAASSDAHEAYKAWHSSLPPEAAKEVASWPVISKSPYSDSFYNAKGITWDHKPDGSLRIADHWNFISRGDKHCLTTEPVEEGKWAMGKYDANTGKYTILKTWNRGSADYFKSQEEQQKKDTETAQARHNEFRKQFIKEHNEETIAGLKKRIGTEIHNPVNNGILKSVDTDSLDYPSISVEVLPSHKIMEFSGQALNDLVKSLESSGEIVRNSPQRYQQRVSTIGVYLDKNTGKTHFVA